MKRKFLFACLLLGFNMLLMHESQAQAIMSDNYNDGLYVQNATGHRTPMPLPIIREADIMWEKTVWREIDFRQKMNQGFYFPRTPHKDMKRFYDVLIDAIKSGEIIAYDADGDAAYTGELIDPIRYSEIEAKCNSTQEPFRVDQIESCFVKEKWYFDKQRSQMMVRIIAICPVRILRDEDNSIVSKQPLFWAPYDNATRTVLVQAPFYNRNNTSNRLSYDDVFLKRLFDSYIYREDNIYDRTIFDYTNGVESLQESERIKQEIIDYEQFLWEY